MFIIFWCYYNSKDTIGYCQWPVFSLRVSQPVNIELNWSSKLRDNNERKNTLVTRSCVLSNACLNAPTLSPSKSDFPFFIISQLRRPIDLTVSQVCYFMPMLRYTK